MKRRKYVRAMLKAIRAARKNYWMGNDDASMTDGLRVIRRFEKVNGFAFDPFNKGHVDTVRGWGWNERAIINIEAVYRRMHPPTTEDE